jgi:hypothetical protein
MWSRTFVSVLALATVAAAIDMGPTFGKDYAGDDYNVTEWHSPSSKAADNYKSAALECKAYCDADPKCCSWTYCPPGSGESKEDFALGERCCLKQNVPSEGTAKHWTGVATRAVKSGKLTPQCDGSQPQPPQPYPGPDHWGPKVHNSPSCLHKRGWHDIAGALTHKDTHHVFQGCPADGGWHHASSPDLVHWDDRGISPHAKQETHAGMESNTSPCSGFVTVDDEGTPCAGFRQCGSSKGVPGGHTWDVPLEIRCSKNEFLTEWSDPIYLFDMFYYRALPYDPVRPWIDADGKWYSAMSTDGCNSTTKKTPCAAGGR